MIAPKSLHTILIPLPLREGVRGRVEALVIVMSFTISPPPHPSPWKGEGDFDGHLQGAAHASYPHPLPSPFQGEGKLAGEPPC